MQASHIRLFKIYFIAFNISGSCIKVIADRCKPVRLIKLFTKKKLLPLISVVVVFYDTDLNHAGLHRGCSNLSCVVVWMWSDDSWIKTKKYSLYLLSDQKKSTKKCMSLCMCVTGCVSPIWTPSNPFTKWDTADGIRWEIGTARWILSDVPQVRYS